MFFVFVLHSIRIKACPKTRKEIVGVPTNYVSLAIEPSFSHILFC
ncbi:hypothetical protein LEP1GSC163_1640 [Leptospira santarosai str. CBC379]|nr:hypothetical protein LEP1GSC163_1640 [Leptospira santarosai str. CBC379]